MDQDLDQKEQQLKDADCGRIFFEKVTGTKKDRPELNHMLDHLREDDTIIIRTLKVLLVAVPQNGNC